jgi:hypothetical protein
VLEGPDPVSVTTPLTVAPLCPSRNIGVLPQVMVGGCSSTWKEYGPAVAQLPAASQTDRVPVDADPSCCPAATVVVREKLPSLV